MGKLMRHLLVHVIIGLAVYGVVPALAQFSESQLTIPWNGRDLKIRANHIIVRMRQLRSVNEVSAILPQGFKVDGQYLALERTVYFQPLGRDVQQLLKTSPQNAALYNAEEKLTRTFTLVLEGGRHPMAAVSLLLSKYSDVVELAEPWYVADVFAAPNDPETTNQQYLSVIKALEAWAVYEGNANIVIGISDDGVSQIHEDLAPNIAPNTAEIPDNSVDDDQNGYVDDYLGCNLTSALDGTSPGNTFNTSNAGHGTKVAGLASAATNNSIGIIGTGFRTRFFPMKAGMRNSTGIIYGYQSLIYAAQRKFKVVNTSWGVVKPASAVDQSVIDYCTANDVLIVASAGNHGDGFSGAGWRELNYPAAYEGVMGVGETDRFDNVEFSSGLGLNADVMAPGNGAYTTEVGGGYTSNGISGTSFAAPMVTGLAGLVRGKYPQLSAAQTAALIRRTADDISAKNVNYAQVLFGRMNMLKAVQTAPMSIPAVRISRTITKRSNGRSADRFFVGDTLYVAFDLVNDLGPVADLTTKLSIAEENGWTIRFLQDVSTVGSMATGETKRTADFIMIIDVISPDRPLIFTLDITNGDYVDRALWYLNKPAFMAQFENGQLVYSMGDNGTVGYNSILTTRQGSGFGWKQGYTFISPSGFILSEGDSRAISGYKDSEPYESDFSTVKPFSAPQQNTNIMTDENAGSRRIGMNVSQKCTFPGFDVAATVFSVRVQNVAGTALTNVSSGYFLDWDIGSGGASNLSRLAPEAIPANLLGQNAAAQMFTRVSYPLAICQAVYSSTSSAIAQSAAMLYSERIDDSDGLSDADITTLLQGGKDIQTTASGDLCSVIGMRFPGSMASQDFHTYIVVIGVGATEADAARVVRETLTSPNSVSESNNQAALLVMPNPATENVTFVNTVPMNSIELTDITGRTVLSVEVGGEMNAVLNVTLIPSGTYSAVIKTDRSMMVRTLLVMH
ncbi:MAG: S8 family peptidase [Ignavibacteria bacterium]|nr:S8 family peptidase [Ignavibacteria bacterium]